MSLILGLLESCRLNFNLPWSVIFNYYRKVSVDKWNLSLDNSGASSSKIQTDKNLSRKSAAGGTDADLSRKSPDLQDGF